MRNQRLYAKVPVVGLCHGVAYNCGIIAQRMGIPREEIDFVCAGINHMTWFIQARHKGNHSPLQAYPDRHPPLSPGLGIPGQNAAGIRLVHHRK